MPKEFLINTPYKCEVIVTNVSPNHKTFDLTYQVPLGTMPLGLSKNMKSQLLKLGPYTTEIRSFEFYLPSTGVFRHFPSNVSMGGFVIARGLANKLNVVQSHKITKLDTF